MVTSTVCVRVWLCTRIDVLEFAEAARWYGDGPDTVTCGSFPRLFNHDIVMQDGTVS